MQKHRVYAKRDPTPNHNKTIIVDNYGYGYGYGEHLSKTMCLWQNGQTIIVDKIAAQKKRYPHGKLQSKSVPTMEARPNPKPGSLTEYMTFAIAWPFLMEVGSNPAKDRPRTI